MNPATLRKLFEARQPCVRLVTYEEPEVASLITDVAAEMRLQPWIWSATSGIRAAVLEGAAPIEGTMNAGAALTWWRLNLSAPAMCITMDLADHLSDPLALRALRELIEHFRAGLSIAGPRMGPVEAGGARAAVGCSGSRLAMIDHKDDVPGVIAGLTARFTVDLPDDEEIDEIVKRTLRRLNRERMVSINLSKRELSAMVEHLRGLSRRQVEHLIAEAIVLDQRLDASDLEIVLRGKRRLLQSSGVLEFVDAPASLDQIGGLDRLKTWLAHRTKSFDESARKFGLSAPRGVLLLGVQGAGKSLAAKAIATAWRRPLLRLDPGALYDRYVGESERRLREALQQAESMSPCVLWIDEIEKGFASAASRSTDGGLSQRMFGTLLTWMQEQKRPVFLVATANDIEALPPELLRKGRFDEIFFVDLPSTAAREAIVAIHLKKRGREPASFDLPKLAAAAHGFSGAEIEAAVEAALHEAYSNGRELATDGLLAGIAGSPPLSVTMRERLDDLRAWAKGRCVPAD